MVAWVWSARLGSWSATLLPRTALDTVQLFLRATSHDVVLSLELGHVEANARSLLLQDAQQFVLRLLHCVEVVGLDEEEELPLARLRLSARRDKAAALCNCAAAFVLYLVQRLLLRHLPARLLRVVVDFDLVVGGKMNGERRSG